jgi:hypothetical protein
MGRWREQECDLALRLRDRLAILVKDAEVDHRVPLFRVWRDHRDEGWPKVLSYWGLPNLQVINRDVHVTKCAIEARYRPSRDFSSEYI